MKNTRLPIIFLAIVLLGGCQSQPPRPPTDPKHLKLVTYDIKWTEETPEMLKYKKEQKRKEELMDFENKQPETWEQAALFRAKAKEEICARLECLESFKWVEVVFRKINMNTSGIILLGKFRFQDAKGEYAIKRFVYEGWSGQLFIEDMESNSALENAWAFYRPEEIKFSTPPSYNYPRGGDPHMGIYNLNPYGVGPRLYNPPIRIIPRR